MAGEARVETVSAAHIRLLLPLRMDLPRACTPEVARKAWGPRVSFPVTQQPDHQQNDGSGVADLSLVHASKSHLQRVSLYQSGAPLAASAFLTLTAEDEVQALKPPWNQKVPRLRP